MSFYFSKSNTESGFSLLEMLVVIAIIGILVAVSVFGYQSSVNNSNVKNAAEEVETLIRQAQVFATSARPFPVNAGSSDSGRFDRGYGVYLERGEREYVMYGGEGTDPSVADDSRYQSGNEVAEINLPQGVEVSQICLGNSQGEIEGDACDNPSNELHIHFRRPQLEAIISDDNEDFWLIGKIVLTSTRDSDQSRSVIIYNSGRVNVSR